MNSLFKLETLSVNNFKLFEGNFKVNFYNNDLIVFDGPNGHGKTTVFDAIELALTGDIRRLHIVDNLQVPEDVVVAHKNNKDCFVELEISNQSASYVIKRKLKAVLPRQGTKISNFDTLWDLTLLENGQEQLLSQERLNELINSLELKRDFTFFHYVEQEDTAHFLKSKSEKERAKALSVLFGDTKSMQDKTSKVSRLEKRLKKLITDITIEQENIVTRIGEIDTDSQISNINENYEQLLPWKKNLEFDAQSFDYLPFEKKEEFISELSRIKQFISYRDYFISSKEIKIAAQQTNVLRDFLGFSSYIEQYDVIRNDIDKRKACLKVLGLFKSRDFNALNDYPYLTHVLDLIGYDKKNDLFNELQAIVEGKKNNTASSSLVSELLRVRNEITKYSQSLEGEPECAYCGQNYETNEELLLSIERKDQALKAVLSEDGKRLETLIAKFNLDRGDVIAANLEKYISSIIIPTEVQLENLNSARTNADRFSGLSDWLNKKEVRFDDLMFNYDPQNFSIENIYKNTERLQERIMQKLPLEPEGYSLVNSELNFGNLFVNYFNLNEEFLAKFQHEKIDLKIAYIRDKYIESLSADRNNFVTNKAKLTLLNKRYEGVRSLNKKLRTTISRYQKSLIKDVEIPFYIYSGKVLQTHQSSNGTGIYIKDKTGADELKNIRFVADWQSDHDVLNTMSSGQIAAIVITLNLALNKVYSQGLGTILIDDPVQTMDEINMISLVELLRNEFSNNQLVLSTHEDHVSKYFLYKFIKYNKNVRQIRLIDRKEYQLSNRKIEKAAQ